MEDFLPNFLVWMKRTKTKRSRRRYTSNFLWFPLLSLTPSSFISTLEASRFLPALPLFVWMENVNNKLNPVITPWEGIRGDFQSLRWLLTASMARLQAWGEAREWLPWKSCVKLVFQPKQTSPFLSFLYFPFSLFFHLFSPFHFSYFRSRYHLIKDHFALFLCKRHLNVLRTTLSIFHLA